MHVRPSLLLIIALHTSSNVVESFGPLLPHVVYDNKSSSTQPSTATITRTHHHRRHHHNSSPTLLNAKAKKKKKATTTSKAGFGTVVKKKETSKNANNDKDEGGDYAAFPALEPGVKETLQPAADDDRLNSKDLSNEMYDRLAQIYGFRDFNFPMGWFNDDDDNNDNDNNVQGVAAKKDKDASGSSDFADLLKPKTATTEFDSLISGSSTSGGGSGSVSDSLFSETMSAFQKISMATEQLEVIEDLPPFAKFRVLHVDPMVLAVDDFLTFEECDEYVDLCNNPKKRTSNNDMPMMSRSKTVGKDSLSEAQRTSTTWFHHFKSVPELMAKASRLFGLRSIDRWEEPQTVRYQQMEKFTWHLDALAPSDGLNDNGGQRVATLLVYLTDVGDDKGGSTVFRDLGLKDGEYLRVQPKKGSALVFFPSAGGVPTTPFDVRTLHAGEALASDAPSDKWIAQLWLRENNRYTPSAPPGNSHAIATEAIEDYCKS